MTLNFPTTEGFKRNISIKLVYQYMAIFCNFFHLLQVISFMRQHIKAVKYWCRVLDLSQNHPVRNAYNMLLELDGTGFTNWCSRIRSVLELTGLDQAWETQHIGNTNKFMLSFKDSIVRIFTQRWRQDIESSTLDNMDGSDAILC